MQAQLGGGSSLRTPMSYEDFRALTEARHHEYFDGMCVVNPPNRGHVFAVVRLREAIVPHCPPGNYVYPEWGWRLADAVEVLPDLMVAPVDAPGDDQLAVAPLLVVEVASPSTRDVDQGRKKELYGSGGASWYWLVDLARPEVIVFENVGGALVEVQRIGSGGDTTVGPFPVAVDPADLARP
jgi:Uma2 family endonuclease